MAECLVEVKQKLNMLVYPVIDFLLGLTTQNVSFRMSEILFCKFM